MRMAEAARASALRFGWADVVDAYEEAATEPRRASHGIRFRPGS